MTSRGVLQATVSVGFAMALAGGVGACGGGSSSKAPPPPPDPVAMATMAPGVRTVIVPKQSAPLTIVVPPCGIAKIKQETTQTPPGSNQVVVPASALDQNVAIQPCMQGQKSEGQASTILLGPGGSGSGSSKTTPLPNQLVLPENANLSTLIVPPCVVLTSSSGSSSGGASGGANTVVPAARGKAAVTAPPCSVQMTSSSS